MAAKIPIVKAAFELQSWRVTLLNSAVRCADVLFLLLYPMTVAGAKQREEEKRATDPKN